MFCARWRVRVRVRVLLFAGDPYPGSPPLRCYYRSLSLMGKLIFHLFGSHPRSGSHPMPTWVCPECGLSYSSPRKRKLCDECKNSFRREAARDERADLKKEFLEAYGGRCQCECGCNISISGFLGLGHTDNSGADHRKQVGGAGYLTYQDLKNRGWPKTNYRVECWNCNFGKRINNGICPALSPMTEKYVNEWSTPPKPVDVVESWRFAARNRHLKIGDRLLTIEECEIIEKLLGCILADLEML